MRLIKKIDDENLLPLIKEIMNLRPSYGYRRITTLLNRALRSDGQSSVNHKRIYRIMAQNKLLMPCPIKRPTKTHDGKIITLKSDLRWCSDTFGLKCWNGDLVQVAFVLDCHDREIITWIASTKGITGNMIQDLMTESVEKRFPLSRGLPRKIQ